MKLGIIGASSGQRSLCQKAKEMGLETICFAWEENAICKNIVDKFYPISILEIDKITEICKSEKIDGIVSNGSDLTAEITAILSERLGLIGNRQIDIQQIRNKSEIRKLTQHINDLSPVKSFIYTGQNSNLPFPCVVKPIKGAGKKGVQYSFSLEQFNSALTYALNENKESEILIEEYIDGVEVSVESISFKGNHFVLQITDKRNTGAPHFAELEHHQPSSLPLSIQHRLKKITQQILYNINFQNGASHIEFKIYNNNIYLIEVNPRGGGDEISNSLVELSTGYDYVRGMIEVALNLFIPPKSLRNNLYSGIYYLCKQTEERKSFFQLASSQPWLIKKDISSYESIKESKNNGDRNGYIIYQWTEKINPDIVNLEIKILNKENGNFKLCTNFISKIKQEKIFYNQSMNDKWIEKILEKADILAYIRNDEVIGWLVLYCNNYDTLTAYCASLHILPEYRHQGLAKNLLEASISICSIRKFSSYTLICNNPIAMKLYLEYKFMKTGEITLNNHKYDTLKLNL